MTESEWLTSEDPAAMLTHLTAAVREPCPLGSLTGGSQSDPAWMPSNRKLRLFACACCRQVWGQIEDAASRKAVKMGERLADGLATPVEVSRIASGTSTGCLVGITEDAAKIASGWCRKHYAAEPAAQAALLRDVVGNPWRRDHEHVASHHDWPRNPTVHAIAQTIYDERDFAAMPVLADALEDAGCQDPHVLCHLRQPSHVHGPMCRDRDGLWCAWESIVHARGCHVLDAILGRG